MIWVDNDATPRAVLEVLFRAARKRQVPVMLVANRWSEHPKSRYIGSVVVAAGADVADDYIVEHCDDGHLVVTADIPLAARAVERGATVINPRGRTLTDADVREALSMRDFHQELRDSGVETGGPRPFNQSDLQSFANSLDRWMSRRTPELVAAHAEGISGAAAGRVEGSG